MKQYKTKRICKDCGIEIFVDINMVIIKDSLWKNICDKHDDDICDICMEKRMGRSITQRDFKESSDKGDKMILCNQWWLWHKEKNKKSK